MNIAKIKDIVNNSKVLKWLVFKARLENSISELNIYRFKAKIPSQMFVNFGKETKNVSWDDKRIWQDGVYYKYVYSLYHSNKLKLSLMFNAANNEIDLKIEVFNKYNDYLLSDQISNIISIRNEWR